MLEYRDIDHVVIGGAGVVAVETKFRSSWPISETELDDIVNQSKSTRSGLARRVRVDERAVKAVVVVWGPDLDRSSPIEQRGPI